MDIVTVVPCVTDKNTVTMSLKVSNSFLQLPQILHLYVILQSGILAVCMLGYVDILTHV